MSWFRRNGTPYEGNVQDVNRAGDSASFYEHEPCSRCGGPGGWKGWPGYTCYRCGDRTPIIPGVGRSDPSGPFKRMVYTAEKLERLNAAAAKRQAKKEAQRIEAEAARAAEANARREDFMAREGGFIERLSRYAEVADRFAREAARRDAQRHGGDEEAFYRAPFLVDVLDSILKKCEVSERQRAAVENSIGYVERRLERERLNSESGYVGSVGERLELTLRVERIHEYETSNFHGRPVTRLVYVTRDPQNNVVVFHTSTGFGEEGETITVRGTVKAHDVYRDTRQTVLQRVMER
jgi:hypothetical protein